MNKLTTIYVPVRVEDELPKHNGTVLIIKNEQFFLTTYDEGIGFGISGGERKWLKPTEAYVHTPEELLELKKKWCSEAFEAGERHIKEQVVSFPNKQTYVNNLTIE